jgi:hypothetical protein
MQFPSRHPDYIVQISRSQNVPQGNGSTREAHMVRRCDENDFEMIWQIINDGAKAYNGVIPQDRYKEPYMTRDELRHEMRDGVEFWAFEEDGALTGVMGIQPVKDVTLIRHAYVRTLAATCWNRGAVAGSSARPRDGSHLGRNMGRCFMGDSVLPEVRLSTSRIRRKERSAEKVLDRAGRADLGLGRTYGSYFLNHPEGEVRDGRLPRASHILKYAYFRTSSANMVKTVS